jgi:hypothetical protein
MPPLVASLGNIGWRAAGNSACFSLAGAPAAGGGPPCVQVSGQVAMSADVGGRAWWSLPPFDQTDSRRHVPASPAALPMGAHLWHET